MLLPEIDEPSIAMVVAEKLIAAASENVDVPGRTVRMHASVGIALFPADGHDFDSLLSAADNAMYAAKAAGRNAVFQNDGKEVRVCGPNQPADEAALPPLAEIVA